MVIPVLLLGPTSSPWEAIADEVEADLRRLERPGVRLSYRTTGAGPPTIRSAADVEAAAPHVVRAVEAAAADGFRGVIVDCTDDPGVTEAEGRVGLPVVGAGAALRAAIDRAAGPVHELGGDELRQLALGGILGIERVDDLLAHVGGATTLALGATGFSHLSDLLADAAPQLTVIDPLAEALELCLHRLDP